MPKTIVAFAIVLVVANLAALLIKSALHAPKSFAPLQSFTLNVGIVTGFLLAQLVFTILRRAGWSALLMSILAMAVWVASISFPARIYERRGTYTSDRFDGMNLWILASLAALHLIVALGSIATLWIANSSSTGQES